MQKEILIKNLRNSKFELEELGDKLFQYRQQFFERYNELGFPDGSDHPYMDLLTIINCISPSYLAPAYHYNNYVDALLLDVLWDDEKFNIPEEGWISGFQRRNIYQIEIQALLLATKTALDRMVSIFSYYYKGITPYTTFGRINGDKSKGFMSIVNTKKTGDDLLSFIHEEYFKWIKIAVEPRDLIVHYNDLAIYYELDSEVWTEMPVHLSNRLIKAKESKEMIYNFGYSNIYEISMNWYIFFNNVMDSLITRSIICDRARI